MKFGPAITRRIGGVALALGALLLAGAGPAAGRAASTRLAGGRRGGLPRKLRLLGHGAGRPARPDDPVRRLRRWRPAWRDVALRRLDLGRARHRPRSPGRGTSCRDGLRREAQAAASCSEASPPPVRPPRRGGGPGRRWQAAHARAPADGALGGRARMGRRRASSWSCSAGYDGTKAFSGHLGLDGQRLAQRRTARASPGARSDAAVGYDATRKRVVLFGGIGTTGALGTRGAGTGPMVDRRSTRKHPSARLGRAHGVDPGPGSAGAVRGRPVSGQPSRSQACRTRGPGRAARGGRRRRPTCRRAGRTRRWLWDPSAGAIVMFGGLGHITDSFFGGDHPLRHPELDGALTIP